MTLPRQFQLDHLFYFTAIEGEPGQARVGESLRTVCTPEVWEVLHAGLIKAIASRETVTCALELGEATPITAELIPENTGTRVCLQPTVVFSHGDAEAFFLQASQLLCLMDVGLGTLLRVNPAWQRVLGYTPEALQGRALYELLPSEDHLDAKDALALVQQGKAAHFECRFLSARGEFVPLVFSVSPGAADSPAYAAAQLVPESRTVEIAIRRQSHRDPLTDLPNRVAIEEGISKLLTTGTHGAFGVLVLALDRFKWVNDALGQDGGDQTLCIVARRLVAALRAEDVVGRLQGDTFVALLPGVANDQAAASVAQKVLHAVQAAFVVRGNDLRLTACVGMALAPYHGTDPRLLLERAETALYEAKKASRGNVALWREGLALASIERLALESRLSRAVDRGEMRLHYQQQVAASNRQLLGFEALVRWHHPERGLISPDTFIPMAEDAGLIGPIGHWVLGEACRQATQWHQAITGLNMSVNLSGRQFAQRDLTQQIEEVLSQTGMTHERLELEITETELMRQDEAQVRAVLFKLKDLGIQLSVDDYGVGYTNWRRLSQLPVDRIKIDKSFVSQVCQSAADEAVVRAIVDLSHTLGMKVVAEGVESEEQHQKLVTLGCDILQDFHYARPLPAAEALRLLPAGA